MALVVGVTTGETELLCFWMIAFMAISWTTLFHGWMAVWDTEDGWADSVAVSAMCVLGGRLLTSGNQLRRVERYSNTSSKRRSY